MVHPIARILLGQFDFIAAFQMIDRTDMGAAGGALLHKDLKCKAPLIDPNLRRNLGKWST